MTTKTAQFQAAFALAQQNLDATNPLTFEAAIPTKAEELEMNMQDYQQFSADARGFRTRFIGLKQQDDFAAKQAAAAAAKPAGN